MKAKHGLILFILGWCLRLVGGLFKVQHWAGADSLLIISTALLVVGLLVFGAKLLAHPKVKEFLNR
ncbi:hypothetical protein [Hymenobacter persicinus]|uniref:Gliding motility protein GldL n=1 Tax=Hymenobacter persicinus TaxID=2025506 RepID=A0A4Q5LD65_9BACT|nr:hypothetical protein [Hymenobacter persicinus]RYU81285.1 hypothetical protein EWM57_06830 [Hymenobacter persicinus]